MNKNQKRKKYSVFALGILCFLLTLFVGKSFATLLDNDVEVKENSSLTYYLNISYDGIDRNGIKSSDTVLSEIRSGYLYVEDKLPDGLIFDGFVTTDDGSIGAVQRGTESACPGKVIDDTNEEGTDEGVWNASHTEYTYHGLHYDENTRKVYFNIKNLKAGCQLTVGIKTITPTVDDPDTPEKEIRRDFYNFALAKEKSLTTFSNTVHVYMGSDFAELFNVTYEYDENSKPENAPDLPNTMSYAQGTKVGVASNVVLEGYTFSGWTTEDVTVNDGSFMMPSKDVVFKGSFIRIDTNKVTYKLDGITPLGYILPSDKNYHEGEIVSVDSLKEGDIFNGYRFLGWETDDVTLNSDGEFEMPDKDVVITGKFEEVTYKVSYQFYDTIIPPNAELYLPDTKAYKPGVTVTLEDVKSEPNGYKFLGWYKEDNFEMPEKDVVIYGEWKVQEGTFEPTITKELISSKDYYRVGDVVSFKITVTNTASFPIKEVIVKENKENAIFIEGSNYTVSSDHIATIDQISALDSVELYANYIVTSDEYGTVQNEVEIKGALSDINYELKDKEYKATASFKIQSELTICKKVSGTDTSNTFGFLVTGTNKYETWVILGKDECKTIYVSPSTYKIKEMVPQEYKIEKVEGSITSDNASFVVEFDKKYEITYTNSFKKKGFLHSFGRVVNEIRGGTR